MASADNVIAYFDDLLARGVKEEPAASNCTEVNRAFGPVGSPPVSCYAWCCATCSVAMKRAGQPGFWTAGVAAAIAAAKAGTNSLRWIARDQDCQRGDFATYDSKFGTPQAGNPKFFHINVVVNPLVQSKFECIGGNESDAVKRSTRDRSQLMGFIRPAYDGISLPFHGGGFLMALSDQEQADLVARVKNIEGAIARMDPEVVELLKEIKAKLATL